MWQESCTAIKDTFIKVAQKLWVAKEELGNDCLSWSICSSVDLRIEKLLLRRGGQVKEGGCKAELRTGKLRVAWTPLELLGRV